MRTYSISIPTLNGVLSDDHLYFEGVRRPVEIYQIRDGGPASDDSIDILEKYFNDVYNLFLRKLSTFTALENSTDEDTTKLQALLQELIKVKKLIIGAAESQEKNLL